MKKPRLPMIAAFAAVLAVAAFSVGALNVRRPWVPRLTTIVRGGEGPPTLVLLHGYGANAEDWEPFTTTIVLPAHARFVFPIAPETTVPPDGPLGGRAWWRLELDTYIAPGGGMPDLAAAHPPGLDVATASIQTLLHDLSWTPGGPVVLGGFSQGAMVASELAFTMNDALAALVLLSGTPVDEASWRQGLAKRRGLPVFVAHGRADPVLSFAAAERFQRELAAAGLAVTWVPFDGGHEIPGPVITALNQFLKPILVLK